MKHGNGLHRFTTDGVLLAEGMEVVLTGYNWIDEGVQGETRQVAVADPDRDDYKVEVIPGFYLFICGTPGKWDDWTVTSKEGVEP